MGRTDMGKHSRAGRLDKIPVVDLLKKTTGRYPGNGEHWAYGTALEYGFQRILTKQLRKKKEQENEMRKLSDRNR